MGSLAAIASGLLIHFLTFEGRYYFDPALSLIIVIIILIGAIPLVRRCIDVFMQKVPSSIDIPKLKKELTEVPGVISLDQLHIWTLIGNKAIGSAHITLMDNIELMTILKDLEKIFQQHNIHSTTIQPIFKKI
uniref:Cation efflux protein cytoplasmic domain-containing protein n=1 Tax=Arcella intermedia TaxID=1963864 RepID=A0A6B2LKR0_9EUKA